MQRKDRERKGKAPGEETDRNTLALEGATDEGVGGGVTS